MKLIKRWLSKTPFFINNFRYGRQPVTDTEKTLVYVHIGKCGGGSLWRAIRSSKSVKRAFHDVVRVHMAQPPILENAKYLIVVRNPIERTVSAFNWRYNIVVENGGSENMIGESQSLTKYKTINNLAESLYDDSGELNKEAVEAFYSIDHMKQNIEFYLSDLLDQIDKEQIFALVTTELLDQDIELYLSFKNKYRVHQSRPTQNSDKLPLSDLARRNLYNFSKNEYATLHKLLNICDISDKKKELLLR